MSRLLRVAVTPIVALTLGLVIAGCTPLDRFTGSGSSAPTPGSSAPSATATPSPAPTSSDCDHAVLTEPGEYHLPDCLKVSVTGRDITVNAGRIDVLIIRGAANDVNAGHVGSADIEGNVNRLDTLDLERLAIDGRLNRIGVHGSVERIVIIGNDNEIYADGDIGTVDDRGRFNVVSAQP